jgi:hypothetical protein
VKKKFTRHVLVGELHERRDTLLRKHKFDPNDGWAQIENCENIQRVVDYGAFDLLGDLIVEYQE